MAGALDLVCETARLQTAEFVRGFFLQWAPAPDVSVCDLRSISPGHLERPGSVAWLCLRLPLVRYPVGRPPIGSHDSLLCLGGTGAVPAGPRPDGLPGRILEPDTSYDHRTSGEDWQRQHW